MAKANEHHGLINVNNDKDQLKKVAELLHAAYSNRGVQSMFFVQAAEEILKRDQSLSMNLSKNQKKALLFN